MLTAEARRKYPNLTNMGKGRPKGSKNRVTKEHLHLALVIARSAVMEKAELMVRLSQQARASVGPHLKARTDRSVTIEVDPDHADTLHEVVVKHGPLKDGAPAWTQTKIKVADPVPALKRLAEIYGLKNQPPPAVDMNALIQMLKANYSQESLYEAALAALSRED